LTTEIALSTTVAGNVASAELFAVFLLLN